MIRLLLMLLVMTGSVWAQTPPIIQVGGSGSIAFDQAAASLAQAQVFIYRAYVGTRPAVIVPTTCSGTGPLFTCKFPLSVLPLNSTPQPLGLTAGLTSADGGAETAKGIAPFLLALISLPAPPVGSSIRVEPAP